MSDAVGCTHNAAMARSLGLKGLLFSKDASPSCLGVCALILQSEFFSAIEEVGFSKSRSCLLCHSRSLLRL